MGDNVKRKNKRKQKSNRSAKKQRGLSVIDENHEDAVIKSTPSVTKSTPSPPIELANINTPVHSVPIKNPPIKFNYNVILPMLRDIQSQTCCHSFRPQSKTKEIKSSVERDKLPAIHTGRSSRRSSTMTSRTSSRNNSLPNWKLSESGKFRLSDLNNRGK
eukprot:TCONS_00011245-protein